jgi:hypothetical protein
MLSASVATGLATTPGHFLLGSGADAQSVRQRARQQADSEIQGALQEAMGRAWRKVLDFEDFSFHIAGSDGRG